MDDVKSIVVHTFTIGDVDDPDLFAADPLYTWRNSPAGKWVLENAIEVPVTYRTLDPSSGWWGYTYKVVAKFHEINITEYYLRWG